ncbi:MAG: energy-coupling factor ABC transporter permease [Gemmataceae bacterium]|nr:energy-coupling factor ABC transporter permease [Gemmataceae bacterium]
MLWAVHISDGILQAPWWLGGYVVAVPLLLASAWRVREEEVPRIALLTAAFFIVSLIHVRVGFTSVHLLMNGLLGIVLGPRAALALFAGLFLQYFLMPVPHGGLQTLGVNTCVLTIPALGAWLLFRASQRLPWVRHPWFRSLLVLTSIMGWLLSLAFSLVLLCDNAGIDIAEISFGNAWALTVHPLSLAVALLLAGLAAWSERRLESAPEFPLGLLLGQSAVMATVALNCAVLLAGGEQHWPTPPLVLLVAHLPIAVFEGVVLGFTLGFLAKVKPELLGMEAPAHLPLSQSGEAGIVPRN